MSTPRLSEHFYRLEHVLQIKEADHAIWLCDDAVCVMHAVGYADLGDRLQQSF